MATKYKYIIFAILCCLTSATYAIKPIKISGKLTFAHSGQLRFYQYTDFLTEEKKLLAFANIDSNGLFEIQLSLKETQLVELAYNATFGQMFLEPEKSYQVEISADTQALDRIDAQLYGFRLYVAVLPYDSSELNYKIDRFERYYRYFFYNFEEYFYQQTPEATYDSLVNLLRVRIPYDEQSMDFYSQYVKYRYASIDFLYYQKNREKVYQKYLTSAYIPYNNISYMSFLNEFYERYVYGASKYMHTKTLEEQINKGTPLFKILDLLGADPTLVNEQVREMVLIKTIGELYKENDNFNRVQLLNLLQQIIVLSKFEEHKTMATNMVQHLTRFQSAYPAPYFTLKDIYNNTFHLTDFAGKYLYLHFFATYNQESQQEMFVLEQMQEQFGDKLQIVSVMLDFESAKLYHYVNEHKNFTWTFLTPENSYSFSDAYQTYTLPLGVLIDPKGKIVSYPALSPTRGLMVQIYTLFSD